MDPRPFLSQPVKPSAQKGLGPVTAPTSPFFRRWESDPTKARNRPCWPNVARFWRYNRISSPIRPRHWKLSSRLGLFYFQRKEGCPASGPRPHKKIKKERCTGYQVHRPVFRHRRVPGRLRAGGRFRLCGPLRNRQTGQPELQRPVPHGRGMVL